MSTKFPTQSSEVHSYVLQTEGLITVKDSQGAAAALTRTVL